MKKIKIIIYCSSLLYITLIGCKENRPDQKQIKVKYSVEEFISGNKKVQDLWYINRMDEMNLIGELRDNYMIIVKYYSLKMKQFESNNLNDAELQREFPKLIRKLNKEASKYLTKSQIKVHNDSWKTILKAIYQKKGWEISI